jgi:hypothetical protein
MVSTQQTSTTTSGSANGARANQGGTANNSVTRIPKYDPASIFPLNTSFGNGTRSFTIESNQELAEKLSENRTTPKSTLGVIQQLALTIMELPALSAFDLGRKLANAQTDSDTSSSKNIFRRFIDSPLGIGLVWSASTIAGTLATAAVFKPFSLVLPLFSPYITIPSTLLYFAATSYMAFRKGSEQGSSE